MHRRGHRGRNPAPAARRNHRNGTLRTKTVDHSAADHPGPSDDQHHASAVLDAATARFATDGFVATTIRRVAADAGVDVSPVMQFFRSKDELFAAVMYVPASPLNGSARLSGARTSIAGSASSAPTSTLGRAPPPIPNH